MRKTLLLAFVIVALAVPARGEQQEDLAVTNLKLQNEKLRLEIERLGASETSSSSPESTAIMVGLIGATGAWSVAAYQNNEVLAAQ